MTIQLRVGLEPLKAAPPGLPKEAQQRTLTQSREGQATIIEAALDMARHGELKPDLQQQYTSLRDLIAASPARRGTEDLEWCDVEELKFKDKLLKLAARAYLQPHIARKSAPQTHFIAQCWITFASTNRSLAMAIFESLQRQADACVKFLRTQTFNLLQRFTSQQQHAAFLP